MSNPLMTIRDPVELAWYGWRSPVPSYVTAAASLWAQWRQQYLAATGCVTCDGRGYRESPPFIEWADDETRVLSTIKVKCKSCKGTGKRWQPSWRPSTYGKGLW